MEITCIACPRGCTLKVAQENGEWHVTGNECKRGLAYGMEEATNPVRTLTTSVWVNNGTERLVSCKSQKPLPKGSLPKALSELSGLRVEAPVVIGQVVFKNAANTGIDIVATRNVTLK